MKIGPAVRYHKDIIMCAYLGKMKRGFSIESGSEVLGPAIILSSKSNRMVCRTALVSPIAHEIGVARGTGLPGSESAVECGGLVGIEPKFETGKSGGSEVGGSEIDCTRAHTCDSPLEGDRCTGCVQDRSVVHHRQTGCGGVQIKGVGCPNPQWRSGIECTHTIVIAGTGGKVANYFTE